MKQFNWQKLPCYLGSVQTLHSIADNPDLLVSNMSDDGSVFDIGAIFSITGSGASRTAFRHLVFTALESDAAWKWLASQLENNHNFLPFIKQLAQNNGANTHHKGVLDENNILINGKYTKTSTKSVIEKFTTIKPKVHQWQNNIWYDYSQQKQSTKRMIALEYIVRLGVLPTSSLLKHHNNLTDENKKIHLQNLGLKSLQAGAFFSSPIVECTSKHESLDRRISHQEASMISALDSNQYEQSLLLAGSGMLLIQKLLAQVGLTLWDGKWEFGTDKNDIIFADTLDTDSIRLTMAVQLDGVGYYSHFSKQAIRDYYQIHHKNWCADVKKAQKQAIVQGIAVGEILTQGQANGAYVATPEIPAEFLNIQIQKFQCLDKVVTALMQSQPNWQLNKNLCESLKADLLDLAKTEINYYKNSVHFADFAKTNKQ